MANQASTRRTAVERLEAAGADKKVFAKTLQFIEMEAYRGRSPGVLIIVCGVDEITVSRLREVLDDATIMNARTGSMTMLRSLQP